MTDATVHVMGPPDSDYTDARYCSEPDAGQGIIFHEAPNVTPEGWAYCASPWRFKARLVTTEWGRNGMCTLLEDDE